MARIDAFLARGRGEGCSDIHIAAGRPPMFRLHGRLVPIAFRDLAKKEVDHLLFEVMSEQQQKAFADGEDLDFTYASERIGRYRVNIFRKLSGSGATFRIIGSKIPELGSLGLPPVVASLADHKQGLVLVTGAAGTGKSTTLAALVDYINNTKKINIITLEDPIEYIHKRGESQIVQREIGAHVPSFAAGLRAALREDPDVILVGEMRDRETIGLALEAAETGHLVFGTLHTASAVKTLDRVIDAMPVRQKTQTAMILSHHLRGVISQRLVRTADSNGRRAVAEILINTPAIGSLIQHRKHFQIPDQLQTGKEQGMQLMDQALKQAVTGGLIDPNEAYLLADDKKLFRRYVTDAEILPQISLGGGR